MGGKTQMKVLFVTSRHRDYLALQTWDGLCDVLGEENVVDAVGCPWLHRSSVLDYLASPQATAESRRGYHTGFACAAMVGMREGRTLERAEDYFDLLVMHSCYADDAADIIGGRLAPWNKAVWIDGGDDAHYAVVPPLTFDAYFRKEIDPAWAYPYQPQHLNFSAPERWFEPLGEEADRDVDIFFCGNPTTNHQGADRWGCCRHVFSMQRRCNVIMGTCGLGWAHYLSLLRRSKFALCPSGAAGCDSMRTFEAVAAGAIPVFVGYPERVREPWFPQDLVVQVADHHHLHEVMDSALDGHDLGPMRRGLREWCLKHHTTRARAQRVLDVLGVMP